MKHKLSLVFKFKRTLFVLVTFFYFMYKQLKYSKQTVLGSEIRLLYQFVDKQRLRKAAFAYLMSVLHSMQELFVPFKKKLLYYIFYIIEKRREWEEYT